MKNLFLAVLGHLQTCADIRWVDMDKGQLEAPERPTLAFPAALISVGVTTIEKAAERLDVQTATITVRLVFDTAASRTAGATPQAALERSLKYLNTEEQVYELFRTFEPEPWSAFECRERSHETPRSDGLVVMRLRWEAVAIVE